MDPLRVRSSILRRLQNGQGGQEDWEALDRLFRVPLLRFCIRHGLSFEDAEDCVQEVLKGLWQGIANYQPPSGSYSASFVPYLFSCAANRAIDFLRRPDRRGVGGSSFLERCHQQASPEAAPIAEDEASAVAYLLQESLPDMLREGAEVLEQKYGRRAVHGARAEVEESTWNAFVLFEIARFHAKEAAALLGMEAGTVHVCASRVRKKIKQHASRSPSSDPPRSQP